MRTESNQPSTPAAATPAAVSRDLLELLRCPLTRGPLRQEGEFLVAEIGGLRYPVRDGIPVMLMEEATLPEGVSSLDEMKRRFAGGR